MFRTQENISTMFWNSFEYIFLRFWNKPNHFQIIGDLGKHIKLCFFKLFWKLDFTIKSQIKSRQINSGSFEIYFKQGIFKILENKWNIWTLFSNHFEWTPLGLPKLNQINFKASLEMKRVSFQFSLSFWSQIKDLHHIFKFFLE